MRRRVETGTLSLVGRDAELAAIESFLAATDRLPAGLVLEGEAGIGKTSLWAAAAARAQALGYRVLATRPVAAEAELALAGLGDLVEPVLDVVGDELSRPQARALRVALLLDEEGPEPDAREVGIAFRGVLRLLAADAPVAVLIDDVQWLDASSTAALQFAARRLGTDPVAFVLAGRAGDSDEVVPAPARAERLAVGGLSPGALHRIVHERLDLLLPRPALRQLHELSAGNPFYAVELARSYKRGAIRLERGEPLPPTLDALVGDRIAALPEPTRAALAAAAVLSRPVVGLVASEAALAPAVDAGVIVLDGDQIRFTHSLLAAAAYGALDDVQRRELHGRLATEALDVEERARHRALAATGPDEDVAAELARAAEVARARGAAAAAFDLAERALALTLPDDVRARRRRTLLAARYGFESGDAEAARRLLEELAEESPRGDDRAAALADLARILMFEGGRRRARTLLREALEDARDPRLRALVEERLVSTSVVLREGLREAWERAQDSIAEAERLGDRGVLARALTAAGFTGGVLGEPDAVAMLERAIELERHARFLVRLERPSFNLAAVLRWRGELDRARSLFEQHYAEATDFGDDGSLAWTADNLAEIEFLAERWDVALRWAKEGDEIAAQTGQPGQQAYAKAMQALVHAHRGDVDAARVAAGDALRLSGDEVAIGWMNSRWALGVLELSLGDPAAAHEALDPACAHAERESIGEPGTIRFVFDDVEALAALGRLEEAERRLEYVEFHARRLERAFALAAAARCRGVLALARGEHEAALAPLERAVAAPRSFERARALVASGRALRTARRRRDARAALTEAAANFDSLGATLFAARAREELARVGGRAASGLELTPAERAVAELVAQGLRNQEVAAELSVAERTVEGHLTRIYGKLGVRSRTQLAARLRRP